MSLNILRINLELDRIHVHDEGDGLGSAEPYLWSVFFKVDGSTISVSDALELEGPVVLHTTPGSHGNLGTDDADEGETITIPAAIGEWETDMRAIPDPPSLASLNLEFGGVVGVVVVMMEEDNVSDDGAAAGKAALNSAVRTALQQIVDTRSISNQDVSEEEINQFTSSIGSKVESAIVNQQNAFENLWSWINPDDTIGTKVFMFTHDELNAGTTKTFSHRWKNEGDWELFGHVTSTVTCPVDAARALLEGVFSSKAASTKSAAAAPAPASATAAIRTLPTKLPAGTVKPVAEVKPAAIDISPMRKFRDGDYRKFPGLAKWFALATRHSPRVAWQVVQKPELAPSLKAMLEWGNAIAENPKLVITDQQIEHAERLLQALEGGRNHAARVDASRARAVLGQLRGKTNLEALAILDKVEPARHPRIMGARASRLSLADAFKRLK
jgi:hypothetical protein